jgi:hypothetical protein
MRRAVGPAWRFRALAAAPDRKMRFTSSASITRLQIGIVVVSAEAQLIERGWLRRSNRRTRKHRRPGMLVELTPATDARRRVLLHAEQAH